MNAAARFLNEGVLSRGWVISIFLNRSQVPLVAMVFAVLISALGVIYVTNTARCLNANIQQAQNERQALHVQWGQLLLEKSTWIMQARIQNIAEGELGMSIPTNKSVVVIQE